jgi:hypothetical protein
MSQDVISILQEPMSEQSIQALCDLFSIKDFQARKLIQEYQEIEKMEVDMAGLDTSNLVARKWEIINGLGTGHFSQEEIIQQDFQREVISLMQSTKSEQTISELGRLTGTDADYISGVIDNYQTIEKYENDMVGLDTSNLLSQKWEIINGLSYNNQDIQR